MKNKLCVIYNTAPRYREAIFQLIDKEYDCDWFFGKTKTDIKEMDLSLLKHTQYYKTLGSSQILYWKQGVLRLLFKKEYQTFFIFAETRAMSDYMFFFLSRILKKKVYIWTHGYYGKETQLERRLKLWQYSHVDGIFVYSDYSRDLMIKQGIAQDKIYTIHNSLHYDQQRALRDCIKPSDIYRKHFNNDFPTIIFIGRLTKVKKLDLLVEALHKLRQKGEYYNLVFVGDGAEKMILQQKVTDLDMVQMVWFYGACYSEQQNAELIYNADLCVAPGNIGLTAMHAMVFGCPCISHSEFKYQMPEFEAILSGVTGDFFEINNVESLMNSVSKWFEEKMDKRDMVRKACFNEIDNHWNPYFQMEIIKSNLILK